jgi:hypothetical protein
MASYSRHTFKDRLSARTIYLSRGHFNGKATWHYLLVDKVRLPILLKESKIGEVDLASYGNILFSGFGDNPPEAVTNCIKKKYGTC